ncbi:hypothetical protein [Sinomicrobium sp. M5D2P17]
MTVPVSTFHFLCRNYCHDTSCNRLPDMVGKKEEEKEIERRQRQGGRSLL